MDFTWLFLQMLLALVVVCVAAVLILRYLLPKLSWAKKWQKGNQMELLARYGLDPNCAIYLVRIGKRYFALGGGEQGLHLITEVSAEEAALGKETKNV